MTATNVHPSPTQLRPLLAPPLPLPLVQLCLNRIAQRAVQRHKKIFARLAAHSQTTYLVDPTDLSFVISLRLDSQHPQIRAHHRQHLPPHQARISGTLRNLMRLIEGELDGDALFFSRALKVEGDTAAIVVLRNALDNMEGNFFDDTADTCGPFHPLAHWALYKLRSSTL